MFKITKKGQILKINKGINKRRAQKQKVHSQNLKNRLPDQYDQCKKFASQKKQSKLSRRKLIRLTRPTKHVSMDRKIKFDMATTILAICNAYRIQDQVYLYCLFMVVIIETLPNELTLDYTNQISVAIIKCALEIFQKTTTMTRENAIHHFGNWDQQIMDQSYQEIKRMRFNINMASFYRNQRNSMYTDAIKTIENYIRTQYQMYNPNETKQWLLKPKHTQRIMEVPKVIQAPDKAIPHLPQTKNSASAEPMQIKRRKKRNQRKIKINFQSNEGSRGKKLFRLQDI